MFDFTKRYILQSSCWTLRRIQNVHVKSSMFAFLGGPVAKETREGGPVDLSSGNPGKVQHVNVPEVIKKVPHVKVPEGPEVIQKVPHVRK